MFRPMQAANRPRALPGRGMPEQARTRTSSRLRPGRVGYNGLRIDSPRNRIPTMTKMPNPAPCAGGGRLSHARAPVRTRPRSPPRRGGTGAGRALFDAGRTTRRSRCCAPDEQVGRSTRTWSSPRLAAIEASVSREDRRGTEALLDRAIARCARCSCPARLVRVRLIPRPRVLLQGDDGLAPSL